MAGPDDRGFDRRSEPFDADDAGDDPGPRMHETRIHSLDLLDRIMAMAPEEDPRVVQYMLLLRHQLETDQNQLAEARHLVEEYEEAYQKLTSPANRIGTFLGGLDDGVASVIMGDTEYVCLIDPKLEDPNFNVGTRVKLNEAYAIVGDLGYAPQGPIVKITELLDDERLRVSMDPTGQQGRLVRRCTDLMDTKLSVGDELRLEPSMRVALELFPQQEVRDYYLEETAEVPWEMVGGQEEAIRVIREAIEYPLLYPELFERFEKKPLKGILLFGPPGCGKTLIGKATAYNLTREYAERVGQDVQEYFMYINGPKILNMWLGESERQVREIFAQAREKAKEGRLVFIFIDEAESLLRTRSSGRHFSITNTLVPQFAAEMDGLVTTDNVVVILTSNRPDYIDPAILRPGRIDRKVKVVRPNRKASRQIFGIYLHDRIPIAAEFLAEHGDAETARQALVDGALEFLWRQEPETEFLEVHLRNGGSETLHWKDLVSGALITSVVERAKERAIRRAIDRGTKKALRESGVTLEDLQEALRVEYRENEIFPKSDVLEDWLKLLDYEPENVVTVKPTRRDKHGPDPRRNVV